MDNNNSPTTVQPLTSVKAKRGRKPKPFKCPWNNETIDGLRRRPSDGRWETSDGLTFTEPDERLAVARYLAMKAGPQPAIILPIHDDERPELSDNQPDNAAHVVFADEEDGYTEIGIPLKVLCAWFRQQILVRPKWLAEHVGIEQVGYLHDLKAPEPLPSFDTIENTWKDHAKVTKEEKRKVVAAWSDFLDTSKIDTIGDITPQVVIAYAIDLTNASHSSGDIVTLVRIALNVGDGTFDLIWAIVGGMPKGTRCGQGYFMVTDETAAWTLPFFTNPG